MQGVRGVQLVASLLLLVVLGSISCVDGAPMHVIHLNLINAAGGNFIYRGGNPNFLHFEYATLVLEMKSAAMRAKLDFPNPFYLIDLNLENPNYTIDAHHINMENDFFSKNPKMGELHLHTILGELTSPFSYNSSFVANQAATFDQWSRDKLPAFVDQIQATFLQNATVPTVTYIHCECGCDRTGEVSGAYYMAYMNMTLHDAHALDEKIAGREILVDNHNALDWYCFYLKFARNYDLTCEP